MDGPAGYAAGLTAMGAIPLPGSHLFDVLKVLDRSAASAAAPMPGVGEDSAVGQQHNCRWVWCAPAASSRILRVANSCPMAG